MASKPTFIVALRIGTKTVSGVLRLQKSTRAYCEMHNGNHVDVPVAL